MKELLAILALASGLAGCTDSRTEKEAEIVVPNEPTAAVVDEPDFAYLLTHLEVISESPLPHKLPSGANSAYRIVAVTQQGNCVGGCPPSTIYVAAYNYSDYQDGHIRLCKIDGIHWFSQVRIVSYKPKILNDVFLVFDVRSNVEPDRYLLYQVSVAPESCTVDFVREHRRGA